VTKMTLNCSRLMINLNRVTVCRQLVGLCIYLRLVLL